MENSNIFNEHISKYENRSKKSVEEKLLNHFVFLKDDNKLNKFYSEFDINEEDKAIINMWEEIINYLYEEIFHCMFLTISDLKQATKIKNQFPSNLNKIIQYLIYNKKYITDKDLKDENFYIYNFPNLYPQKSYFSSIYYFLPKFNYCKSGNDNNNEDVNNDNFDLDQETSVRKDLGKNYSCESVPYDVKFINYKIFKNHCNAILFILNDILSEEGEEVVIKKTFINTIKEKYINTNLENGKFKLLYGLQLIDEVLFYLKHTKQIIIFKIKENQDIEFIRPSQKNDDCQTEDDIKIAKILLEEFNKNL